jgi:glutamate formiminotransferase
MPSDLPLLAVPNVSEGRSQTTIGAIAAAFTATGGARLLDVHSDPDHHRSVFTLAGEPGALAEALVRGAEETLLRVDVSPGRDPAGIGRHPHVGAIDVVPVVYLDRGRRGAACAEVLIAAAEIGEGLRIPVFLYGELSGSDPGSARTRADLRRGGVEGLAARLAAGECHPDFGPPGLHPTAGATLLAARPPLVAFNLELAAPAGVAEAKAIAAAIREGGTESLAGLRAIGIELAGGVGQVSMNVERPLEVPLGVVVEAVRRHAGVARAELVGLAPRAALEGFPEDLPMPGFDPARHVIENALGL